MTKKVLKDIIDEKINKNDIYNYVVNKKRKNIYATLKYASLVLICIGIILFGYRSKAFKNDNNSNVDEIHINEISKITVRFYKAKNAKKYQIQYAYNRKFKNAKKKVTVKNKLVLKVKAKKTCYIRVRGINQNKKGKWSKVKTVKKK